MTDSMHAIRNSKPTSASRSSGFSLVELMIALVLAGVLLLGMAAYFVSSSRNFSETERVSRQIENGRYAASLLGEDIRHAGFYGEVGSVLTLPLAAAIPMPASLPNPCSTDIASISAALPVPIQAIDDSDTSADAASARTCLPDWLAGTDILVIRRANTTTIDAPPPVTDGYYTQTGFCNSDNPMFKVAQSNFTMTESDCTKARPIREYHVYIYYIGTCSIGSGTNGACAPTDIPMPTLKRAELVHGGAFNLAPLVEGIEDMQLEYGIDTTGDGVADSFTANPTALSQAELSLVNHVVAIRLHLLARNTDATPGYTDTKTYNLGITAAGGARTFTPSGTAAAYHRHAYTQLVRIQNVSQRIEATF